MKLLRFQISLLSIFTLIISSCGTISPESPNIQITDLINHSQPRSHISIPIKINLRPYFEETDSSIPTSFTGKKQQCEGTSYSYQFNRGPIHFDGMGSRLLFDVDGKYSLKINYCPQCTGIFNYKGNCVVPRIYSSCGVDEPKRDIEVGYATKIRVTDNYMLSSETKLRKVKPLTPCEITVFNYDATATLTEEITSALKELEKDIDSEISSIDLRPDLQDLWSLLEQSMEIEDYGFLYLNPKEVSMSPITFKGDTAYFNAILEAQPTIITEQIESDNTKIPSLKQYDKRNGFDISMDVYATYDSLSSVLNKNIQGTEVPIKNKKIRLDNAEIYGAKNSEVHLKVSFSGDKKGTFFFTGTPIFDSTLQKLTFPDIEFDVKTKSALLKSAKWLFNKKITTAVRNASEIDLKPYLDTMKAELNQSINVELTKGTYMSGEIEDVKMNFIHPMEAVLHLRFRGLGKLEIQL